MLQMEDYIHLTRNPFPSDILSIEQMLELEKKAVSIAMTDTTFWDRAKTIEEEYKDLYSAKNPPPYWWKIGEDYSLGKKLGMVTIKKLPEYGDLTRKERLLLEESSWHQSIVDDIVRKLYDSMKPYEEFKPDGPPNSDIRMCANVLPDDYIAGKAALTQSVAEKWFEWSYKDLLVSPITNRMIRLDQVKFSPGEAYAQFHYLDDTWQRIVKPYSIRAKGVPPSRALDSAFIYYRIYGEKGVVAEGVRALGGAGFRHRYYQLHAKELLR